MLGFFEKPGRQTCSANNSTAQVYCQYLKNVLVKLLFISITISGMEDIVFGRVIFNTFFCCFVSKD